MDSIRTSAQLVDHLAHEIETGRLLPGERLDPVRTMSERLDLAPNTVAAAYRALGRRGLLVGRGRAGTFVAEPGPVFSPAPVIPEGAIDLALGNPDPDLLPDVASALSSIDVPGTLYGDVAVLPELEAAARRWLADLPGDMGVVSGALDGVERVLSVHLSPGDSVGVEDPGWPAVFDLVRSMRLRPVPFALDDEGPIPESVAGVAPRVQALVFTSRMQNPTGACISGERADSISRALATHPGVLTVEDDHAPAIAGCELHTIGPGRDRWAVVQSFSKSLSPDLRLATVVGDPGTMAVLSERQAVGPGWVSHLLQRLATALLDDPAVRSELVAATRVYADRRQTLLARLRERGIEASGRSGLNVWIPVADEGPVVARCLEAGYAIRPGEPFRIESSPGVRVTTATLEPAGALAVSEAIGEAVGSGRSATRAG